MKKFLLPLCLLLSQGAVNASSEERVKNPVTDRASFIECLSNFHIETAEIKGLPVRKEDERKKAAALCDGVSLEQAKALAVLSIIRGLAEKIDKK